MTNQENLIFRHILLYVILHVLMPDITQFLSLIAAEGQGSTLKVKSLSKTKTATNTTKHILWVSKNSDLKKFGLASGIPCQLLTFIYFIANIKYYTKRNYVAH